MLLNVICPILPSRTVICIKRASNVGYEVGLEEHHFRDEDEQLSTDSLVVSNQEQAKTIVGVFHSSHAISYESKCPSVSFST